MLSYLKIPILILFFFCFGLKLNLEATSKPLFEKLLQESPEAFTTSHILQEVNLSTGAPVFETCDALLLGGNPLSLVRYTAESAPSHDLSLGEGWHMRLNPTWKVHEKSDTVTTIDIPTLDTNSIRYSLTLTREKSSKKEITLQLSSQDGPLCRYSLIKTEEDSTYHLHEIQRHAQEPIQYTYIPHPTTKRPLLATVTQGGIVQARYAYDHKGRVKEVWHPLGATEALVCSLTCRYEETDQTTIVHVQDAQGGSWRYHFSMDKVLTSIDTLLDGSLMRTERFAWQDGRLITYSIHNPKKACLGARVFAYTAQGKCASSTLMGNLTGMGPDTFSLSDAVETLATLYTYDEQGRLIETEQDATQHIFQYLNDSSLITADYTLRNHRVIHRIFSSFDHEGNLVRYVQDDGSSMDANSLTDVKQRVVLAQTILTGPKGKGLPHCIDALHVDLESNKEQIDHTWICQYDAQGHLIQRQECNGKGELFTAISYAYDGQGKLIMEAHLEGPTYTYLHSPRCIQILCSQKSGTTSAHYFYDFAGHLIREEQASLSQPSISEFRYSPLGHCLEQIHSPGAATTFQYDALGRKTQEKRPAILGSDDKPYNPRLEWHYDLLDRPLTHIDADGYQTHLSCTLYGHPYKKNYPDNSLETLHYTKEGRLDRTCNRAGKEIIMDPPILPSTQEPATPPLLSKEGEKIQNALGQWVLQKRRTKGQLIEVATYDALDNLVTCEEYDQLGQRITLRHMRYDGSGRCILERWFRVAEENLPYTIARTYGPMGRLEILTEGVGTDLERKTHYHYDTHGRLAGLTKPDGCQIHYTYDQEGRLATLHASDKTLSYAYHYDAAGYPIAMDNVLDGTTLKRHYDAEGRLLEETLISGQRFAYQYDAQGRLLDLELPDGSHTCYAYDESGLRSITRQNAFKETRYTEHFIRNEQTGELEAIDLPFQLGEVSYKRDGAHKRSAVLSPFFQQTLGFCEESPSTIASEKRSDPAGSYSTSYTHDAKQQLIEERHDGQGAPATKSYTYDALGNRIAYNGKPSQFHTNNALDRSDRTHYTYDANGNRVRAEGPSGNYLYRYDALDRLICIEKPKEARTTYAYDPLHRRSTRTTWTWSHAHQTWQQQAQEHFLYQEDLEIGTVDSSGNTLLRVLMPQTPSESGATVAIEHHGQLYVPLHDLHGSICVLVDAYTRQPIEYYRKDAFGQEQLYQIHASTHTPADPQEALNPWRMEGKRHDPESGLIYYGRRFYDPSIGIWLTKDPLGFCDGPQDFLFVRNNPLHRTDLHGLYSLSKFWSTLSDYSASAVHYFQQGADKVIKFLLHDHKILDALSRDLAFVRGVCSQLISAPLLKACDFYTSQPNSGVYGNGEIGEKIRFSYVNGILNTHDGVIATLEKLSNVHGGANIHYTYRPTEGWSLDLLKGVLLMKGYTSPTAHSLVGMWRELIEEMGGIESNGTIIHYAHSLGSAETIRAQSFLSEAEKRKIRVFTFGSPVLIPETAFAGVTNYVSRLDLVSLLFDPYRYFSALFSRGESNIIFIGSYWGIPLMDHYIDHKNYMQILTGLGRFFARGVNETRQ